MELKVGGASMVFPKRVLRLFRARNRKDARRSNVLETIVDRASGGGVVTCIEEGGAVRVKITVKKQDLEQVLEVIRGGKSKAHPPKSITRSSSSAEQRLILLRKKHLLGSAIAAKESSSSSWSPALQSIPEELQA